MPPFTSASGITSAHQWVATGRCTPNIFTNLYQGPFAKATEIFPFNTKISAPSGEMLTFSLNKSKMADMPLRKKGGYGMSNLSSEAHRVGICFQPLLWGEKEIFQNFSTVVQLPGLKKKDSAMGLQVQAPPGVQHPLYSLDMTQDTLKCLDSGAITSSSIPSNLFWGSHF